MGCVVQKFCVVIIVYNTDQIYKHGGIEKVMASKANYFVEHAKFNVHIITTEQELKKPCYQLNDNVEQFDLGVNYDRSRSYWSLYNIKKAIFHCLRQYQHYKQLKPDVVISPNYNFDHYWLPFILPKKTKLIKELHSSRYYEADSRKKRGFKNKIFWKLQDWIESKYDKIVVLNADEVIYRPGTNVVCIHNPVEESNSLAATASTKVIAAGRMTPVKGFEDLISAWGIVHSEFSEWQLHIYGDNYGNNKQRLQGLVEELGLSQSIQLKPSVSNFIDTMTHYSIFALSSRTECFPTVLLEALSIGMPVVSYDCPNGPRHIISHEQDGILIKNRSPYEFAQALISLIQNDKKRMVFSKNAKKNSAKFHTSTIMNQWVDLLNNINL